MWMFGSEKLRQRQERVREEKERRVEEKERQDMMRGLEQRWQSVKARYTENYRRGDLLDLDTQADNTLILSYANPLEATARGAGPLDHGMLADAAGRFITQGLTGHAQKLHAIRERSGLAPQDLVIRNLFFDRNIGVKMRA